MNNRIELTRASLSAPTIVALLGVLLVGILLLTIGCSESLPTAASNVSLTNSGSESDASSNKRQILSRLFWQDRDQGLIFAADLCKTESGFEIAKMEISGLKKIDIERQDFVQMVIQNGSLIVGVRDHSDGTESSGWLGIDSGVEEESHGDHSHWHYDHAPKKQIETLDTDQGNPAHVYQYGNHVYIANDKKNGFSMIRLDEGDSTVKFFQGGGGHITLAAVGDQIAYSTWIDRAGENAGRVDVVDLRSDDAQPKYSFKLPSGGIHGATACGNRVFFAPSDGVCWVDCDFDFVKNAETVDIHPLSLGENETDIYRTGAFETLRDHVLCVGNCKDCPPAICLIDGTTPNPKVTRYLCDELGYGLRLSTVKATTVGGRPFVVAFAEGSDVDEKLLVFDLDSNQDRKLGDIKLVKSIDVGKSKIEGHFGHHGITFLNDQKLAVITNPGDGTVSLLNLKDWVISETIEVGGQPTHVVAYGGRP